jgi:hypothetical protein
MTVPEGPLRTRQRSHFLVRWDAVITCILALVIGVCIGMAVQFHVDHADPWNGVPWCTDAMIDQMIETGDTVICHGDPAMNPAEPEPGQDA